MRTGGPIKKYCKWAALFLGCFFVYLSCENSSQELDNVYNKKIAVEEAYEIQSFLSQNGKTKAELISPYMLRYQGFKQGDTPYIEFPRTLHVNFYDTTGTIESTLDARYAKFLENDRKILLRDSVVVINIRNGDTLITDELWWDQVKEEIYTDKPNQVRQPDKTLYNKKGLRAAQNFSHYTMLESSGPLQMPEDNMPE